MRKRLYAILFLIGVVFFFTSQAKAAATDNEKKAEQQARESLKKIISIDLVDVSLEKALSIISHKGDLKLNFNRSRIPVHKRINIKLKNVKSGRAIQEVLKNTGIELQVTSGGQLALIPAKNKPLPAATGCPI